LTEQKKFRLLTWMQTLRIDRGSSFKSALTQETSAETIANQTCNSLSALFRRKLCCVQHQIRRLRLLIRLPDARNIQSFALQGASIDLPRSIKRVTSTSLTFHTDIQGAHQKDFRKPSNLFPCIITITSQVACRINHHVHLVLGQ